ncbi:hypothetical protein LOC71_19110 [Rhodopirellula sp. JC740]|uniref:DUF4129 domain-containing protein n=1 Tax=Rhodopirellula halodulae TaxID=2894198 RepID=A0ABS8NLH5_9BACT|nr:hypothetical protein [Rhodopirellula sp. JC740]MCC9644387.1 hypothetical protein [Rhodopirellula sp. JC740]
MIDTASLRFRDPALFLVGWRDSILRVLQSRWSLLLGGLLVATAAMAREYDAVSWLHQPSDLLGPFAASLVFCGILFVVVSSCLGMAGRRSASWWVDLRMFLSGYWMTAPLAWLYAIPIETMTDELTALKFNLTLLSIVSIWRVLLFSRVVSVQFGVRFWQALAWIVTPCMVIAFVAVLSKTLSMVSLMGGVRLTETQQTLLDYQEFVGGLCFYGFLPSLLIAIVGVTLAKRKPEAWQQVGFDAAPVQRLVWVWPGIACVVLCTAAIGFQPNLYQAAEVDQLLRAGKIDAAIQQMQRLGAKAFPMVWDPPPKYPERGDGLPEISAIAKALQNESAEPWIVDRLLVQADEIALRQSNWYQGSANLSYIRRHMNYLGVGVLEEMLATLREVQKLDPGDADTRQHRAELIEAIEMAHEMAVYNEEEVVEFPSDDQVSPDRSGDALEPSEATTEVAR